MTTTRATGRGEAAGAAFARAHGHIPLSVRCERRDGGVGGWVPTQSGAERLMIQSRAPMQLTNLEDGQSADGLLAPNESTRPLPDDP